MIKHIKEFFKILFNTEHIKTNDIIINSKPYPSICMWLKLKEKALSENNEVNNQILRMMSEVELENEIKSSFYINNIYK